MSDTLSIPLPRSWSKLVRRAFVMAVALERAALLAVRAGFERSADPRAHLCAELDAAHEQLEILTELLRLWRARFEHIAAAELPHYRPEERLAILALRARAGWNAAQTAKHVGVTPKTIASWARRLDEEGPHALVQTQRPVNAFDDAIGELVHQLHDAAPGKGRRKKAELLLRVGLRLADSTVQRILRTPRPRPAPPPAPEPKLPQVNGEKPAPRGPARVVTAKRPHHVWHVDITTVPIGWAGSGFWVPWWPFALILRWALSWHIALVLDHHSRALLAFRVTRSEPTAADICELLDEAVRRAGARPKHVVRRARTLLPWGTHRESRRTYTSSNCTTSRSRPHPQLSKDKKARCTSRQGWGARSRHRPNQVGCPMRPRLDSGGEPALSGGRTAFGGFNVQLGGSINTW